MKLGLLWYDGDPDKPLDVKLDEASGRYRFKFGVEPTICYVNPAHLEENKALENKIRLQSAKTVPLNHIWLEIAP